MKTLDNIFKIFCDNEKPTIWIKYKDIKASLIGLYKEYLKTDLDYVLSNTLRLRYLDKRRLKLIDNEYLRQINYIDSDHLMKIFIDKNIELLIKELQPDCLIKNKEDIEKLGFFSTERITQIEKKYNFRLIYY